jgi:5'-3' exonuclease
MGVKGLYSCLKQYSFPIDYKKEEPSRLGLDAYAFLYKYREDIDSCMNLFKDLQKYGHSMTVFMEGTPPPEKMEELAARRQQKESAYLQAKSIKEFLDSPSISALTAEAQDLLKKQVLVCEFESWSIRREIRERFVAECEKLAIPVYCCEGEADNDLIHAALKGQVDIVIANDMDLFVGGVERLWLLGKGEAPFAEFRRSAISRELGIHPKSWPDVAIVAGYEKCPELKRTSAHQAIIWMRYYGCLENLFSRRPELLKEHSAEDFYAMRKFF